MISETLSTKPIPVQELHDPLFSEKAVTVSMLRLDLVHHVISGNKWFKLKNNLQRARDQGHHTILSFGGAWSNHLHALAHAGHEYGFNTIGLVRGELPKPLNPCLQESEHAGMRLHGITREQYADKSNRDFIASLQRQFGDFFLVPEGGANRDGIEGCGEISGLIDQECFDTLCMACGTGTMLAGLALSSNIPLLGFQVLKGEGYLENEIHAQFTNYGLTPRCDWTINDQFHFGGYARVTDELWAFIENFQAFNSIPLEPVYSAKMLAGLYSLIKRDFFPQNSSILTIHGGGLQGRRGFTGTTS